VKGSALRPTADRVKEALFSILGSRVDVSGMLLLDLFAGSGGLGIEALSRGAASVTFVEQHGATCRVLRENLHLCGFDKRATIMCVAVRCALAELSRGAQRFDGAFIDPPYGRGLAAATLAQLGSVRLLRHAAWVMVEHHADDALANEYGDLRLTHSRRYGKTTLSLFRDSETESADPES
jgi:16S rRNA (guanine(966)-N(2))-methyltransferase RsmD